MDRQTMLQHLAMAERHVTEGEIHLSRQRPLIAELDRDGHDIADARTILATMLETQQLHVEDRDRMLKELSSG
jgi:hypothetical protein